MTGGRGITAIISIDLDTGERAIFSGENPVTSENPFSRPYGIVIDAGESRARALVLDASDQVIAVSLTNGEATILSSNSVPTNEQPLLDAPIHIALDPEDQDVAYIVDESTANIQKLDLVTGLRTLISDNNLADAGPELEDPRSILIDSRNNRALVGDAGRLFSVDLTTGIRETISNLNNPQEDLPLYGARGMVSDDPTRYVYMDTSFNGIVKVDVDTGARSLFFEPFSSNGSHFMHALHLESGFSYILYLDNRTQGIYAIDLNNGEYVIISKSAVPMSIN